MKSTRRIFGPVSALVAVQVVWVVLVVLWITWFLGRNRELQELAGRYRTELLVRGAGWFDLFQGLVLLSILLAGAYALFLFWRRQSRLYQQQREFITQVTHELKSPLASIQLHLETIRLRRPSEDRLDAFVETMLDDTRRLHSQIDNLLLAARLEQRRRPAERREIDLSAFVSRYLEENRDRLPPGTRLVADIEPALRAAVEPDEMGTVLRNLLENAVLYSPGQAEITVRLSRQGRTVLLAVRDQGQGIAPEHLKKIFNRFYRVEPPGDRIRGTGLGLYIVQSVAKNCGGSVTAESAGPGTGCTITLQLPLLEKK
ncbi:sensor histidine kinase [Trichlorobacter ammonificans]|uniref:sensor histidine kinase n=1 Tax=Trichlorobacter ammonificans TaxID=2916410 RepID=UPI002737E640|nr:HAMP domain-containing sensor histidine kinase [Trichlorobacter ammonificans]